jgi:glycosyltransferase 2 family protein
VKYPSLKNNKNITLAVKIVISLTIIASIVRYIILNLSSLENIRLKIDIFNLGLSFLFLMIYIFNQFVLWYYLTRLNGCSIGFIKSIAYRAYSEFGKYVPGKVLSYAMLFYSYGKENKSKTHLAFTMFIELLGGVLASTLIFLVSIYCTDNEEFNQYRAVTIIFLILFFIFIHPKILNLVINLLYLTIKAKPVYITLSYVQLLSIVFLYLINFMLYGLAFMIFINSILPLPFANFYFITGIIAASGVVGMFAFFVPAGLGIREGILTVALSTILPPVIAGIVALSSRIWMVLAEIILISIIFLVSRIKRSESIISLS